jgi:peptidoglycan/xylan/chitin deacetylase (PgdA/CDA1 family)
MGSERSRVVARPWVCLVYHDVTPAAPLAAGGPEYFAVSAETFGRELDLIRDAGLRGCSIADALARPDNAVAITFDDGDLGQADRAFPALAKRGMTATFFVTTGWMGKPKYASWDQLREMKAAGMSIQSHTHSHPFLSELDAAKLRDELRRSREILDEQLGQQTTMIAFPGGDAPRSELRGMLQEEGYSVIGTSRWGTNRRPPAAGPWHIRRCTVRGAPADADFRAIITADVWLGLRKRARERALAMLRASLGPSRYARWRRGFLDRAVGSTG